MPAKDTTINSPTLSGTNVLVGGKVLIMMDGYIVGFANSAQCSDSYNLVPVHIIGQLQAIEMVPTNATHSITLSLMVMRNDGLTRRNLEPVGAGSYGYLADGDNIGGITGLASSYGDATAEATRQTNIATSVKADNGGQLVAMDGKAFNIAIIDGKTGKAIVEYVRCYFAQGSFTISANQVIGHSVTFLALDKRGQWDAESDTNNTGTGLAAFPVLAASTTASG